MPDVADRTCQAVLPDVLENPDTVPPRLEEIQTFERPLDARTTAPAPLSTATGQQTAGRVLGGHPTRDLDGPQVDMNKQVVPHQKSVFRG